MKRQTGKSLFLIAVTFALLFFTVFANASYQLSQLPNSDWDGTRADRLQPEVPGLYQFDYGDGGTVEFSLPWSFSFYGTDYNQLTADDNGNIWFGAVGSGSRIAAWNTDLNSYYSGGTFVEYKTEPERVVVQWLTEASSQSGYGRGNNFETVLYPDGTISLNYRKISSFANSDQGSGISDGTVWLALPASVVTLGGTSFFYSTGDDSDHDGVSDNSDNCPLIPNDDQLDFDADGIGDICDLDDDNDGLPDTYEESYTFLDPKDPTDGEDDYDQDGLTNIQEYRFGSSPVEGDSDFDGVSDLSEWTSIHIMPIINNYLLNN